MDISYRVELQADRMPWATEAMAFTDHYKHMECLGGMRLQSFLTLFTRAMPGTPATTIYVCHYNQYFFKSVCSKDYCLSLFLDPPK